MDLYTLFESKVSIALLSTLGGVLVTLLTQRLLNKRGLFTYTVVHNKIGMSADDAIYGAVRVTWNENPIAHLYLSTIELFNQSSKDYESIVFRVFTNNTSLLNQRTEIVGTTHGIDHTEEYNRKLIVPVGQEPSESQLHLHFRQREYKIPTMNRGQVARLQFLNAASSEDIPAIFLEVLHKGVRLKYQVMHNQFLGVPRNKAALIGTILGFGFVGLLIAYCESIAVAAMASFVYGVLVVLPGVYTVKLWKRIRDWVTD